MQYFKPAKTGLLIILFFGFSFFTSELSAGDPTGAPRPLLELTTTPISKYNNLKPDELAVLGIHLGMSKLSVKKRIAKKTGVYLRQDKFHDSRMYLYEYVPENVKQQPLAYFKWDKANQIMEEIIIYPQFANYMPRSNDYLVTDSVIAKEGRSTQKFGKIRKQEFILEVPSQGIYHWAYYFDKRGFRVIKQMNCKRVRYTFSWFRAQMNGKPPSH